MSKSTKLRKLPPLGAVVDRSKSKMSVVTRFPYNGNKISQLFCARKKMRIFLGKNPQTCLAKFCAIRKWVHQCRTIFRLGVKVSWNEFMCNYDNFTYIFRPYKSNFYRLYVCTCIFKLIYQNKKYQMIKRKKNTLKKKMEKGKKE